MVKFELDDKKKKTLRVILDTINGRKVYPGITKEQYDMMYDPNGIIYDDNTIDNLIQNDFKAPVVREDLPIKLRLESKETRRRGDVNINLVLEDLKKISSTNGLDIGKISSSLEAVNKFLIDTSNLVLPGTSKELTAETKNKMLVLFKKCFINLTNNFELNELIKLDSVGLIADDLNRLRIPKLTGHKYNDESYKSEMVLVKDSNYSISPIIQQTLILTTLQIMYICGIVTLGKNGYEFIDSYEVVDRNIKDDFFFRFKNPLTNLEETLFNFSVYIKDKTDIKILNRWGDRSMMYENNEFYFDQYIVTLLQYIQHKQPSEDIFINTICARLYEMTSAKEFYLPIPKMVKIKNDSLCIKTDKIVYTKTIFKEIDDTDLVLFRNIRISNFNFTGRNETVGQLNEDKLDIIIELLKQIANKSIETNIVQPTENTTSDLLHPSDLREEITTVIRNLKPTEVIKRLEDPYADAPLKKEIETFNIKKLKHVNIAGLDLIMDQEDDLYNGMISDPLKFLLMNKNPLYKMFKFTQSLKDSLNDKYKINNNDEIVAGLEEFQPENSPIKVGFVQAIIPIIRGAIAAAPIVLPLLKKGFNWIKEKIQQRKQQGELENPFSEGYKVWDIKDLTEDVFKKDVNINEVLKKIDILDRFPIVEQQDNNFDLSIMKLDNKKFVPEKGSKLIYQGRFSMGELKLNQNENIKDGIIPNPIDFIMRNTNPLYKIFKTVQSMSDRLKSKYRVPKQINDTIVSGLEQMNIEKFEPEVGFVQAIIPIAKAALRLAPIVYPILKKGYEWIKNKIATKNSGFDQMDYSSSDNENENESYCGKCGTIDVAAIKPESRTENIKDFSKFVDMK